MSSHVSSTEWRWRLLWLIAIPVGLLLFMWQAAQFAREQALSNLQDDAENELRLSAANLNGYLLRYDYLPQMLATREGIQRFLASPDPPNPFPAICIQTTFARDIERERERQIYRERERGR